MARLFGTDGVRGLVGEELTQNLAYRLGYAGAKVLAKTQQQPHILIGMDTRGSGPMLQNALAQGIVAAGGAAVSAGVVPTPAVAYLVQSGHFKAGVVISASHNPAQYNGIKFFDEFGYKLPDALEDEIEAMLEDIEVPAKLTADAPQAMEDAEQRYIDFLTAQADVQLTGKTIVLDCANGASSNLAQRVFEKLGAKVIVLHNQPDGKNINDGCGSTHPEKMCQTVRQKAADFGFAFDGDADRLIACDETGTLMDGDKIMGLLAIDMKENGQLKKDTLVATVMSNMGLALSVEPYGIKIATTKVGDRYVLEEMKNGGYNLGGEQSGHLLLTDQSTTGDGMQSAIHLASLLMRSGEKASQCASKINIYPQVLRNVPVAPQYKTEYMKNAVVAKEIRKMEAAYQGKGRLLIRPSGTEHLVRIMIEVENQAAIEADARALAEIMERELA
ncbi:MAG: phosphoglucosamine mutase [Clostridiales bacterium]|nr:phosphoglucosamine mutase [Clostridiales bacterium]